MLTAKNNRPNSLSNNRLFLLLIGLYAILLLIVTSMACYFSYAQKKEELMSEIDGAFVQLAQEYRNITDNFWQIYMPIFEVQGDTYDIWKTYFNSDGEEVLDPFEKKDLESSLRQMLIRDNDVQWIVLYNGNRSDNYILYSDSSGLKLLPEDFPYLDELNSGSQKMNVYGMRTFSSPSSSLYTYAICGGIPSNIGKGKILAGYTTSSLYAICSNNSSKLKSLNYVLTNNNEILFDYSNRYENGQTYCAQEPFTGISTSQDGKKLYVNSETCGMNTSLLSYYISWWEILRYCHRSTPLLISVFLIFAAVSVMGYILMLNMIGKEVAVINNGLTEIGENNLDYRIPVNFKQSGLPEIATSINQMTVRLKDNINRAYYYELKQREAELSELQSKFNPHFLYNTLEMLRSRCQLNGDDTTANLITQLSAIFRGFIGSKNFIPITDELTFSKRYLALFGARYENMIEIRYDFDKEILKYGIIRNLFQPLIENYFVHGFDTSNEQNYILFKGKSLDDKTMLLTVEDNGSGMTTDEMEELNARLHEPIQIDTESYGLKNLHQRLQLFYGGDCGLTVYPNPNSGTGLSIQMTALKLTCAEYEENKKHGNSGTAR